MSERAKSFATTIASIEGGAFNDQLSREVQELIGDMSNHAQSAGGSARGKVSLSFDFSLDKGVFTITADKKVTAPKEAKSSQIFWADQNNNLTEENPKQRDFFKGDNVQSIPAGAAKS